MATKNSDKKTKRKGRNKKATQQNTEAKVNDTNTKAAQQNSEENDGNNAEAKKNVCKWYRKIMEYFYIPFEVTALADYSTKLAAPRGKNTMYYTIPHEEYGGKNSNGKIVRGMRLDCSQKKKKNDTDKKLMLAFEQASKGNEWLANRLHSNRKGFFLFVGFNVSISLLLQRYETDNFGIALFIKIYMIFVLILAMHFAYVFLRDKIAFKEESKKSEIKSKKFLGGLHHPPPFMFPLTFLKKEMFKVEYNQYLMICIEELTIDRLKISQRAKHEVNVFSRYLIAYMWINSVFLCVVIVLMSQWGL